MNVRAMAVAIGMALLVPCLVPAASHAEDVGKSAGRWEPARVLVHIPERLDGWHASKAIRAWRASGAIQIVTVATPCANCITIRQSAPYNVPGAGKSWNGFTSAWIWPTDGSLARCDVQLNDTTKQAQKLTTLTHEFGHCLGLPHSDVAGSVMNEMELLQGEKPASLDMARLASLYS